MRKETFVNAIQEIFFKYRILEGFHLENLVSITDCANVIRRYVETTLSIREVDVACIISIVVEFAKHPELKNFEINSLLCRCSVKSSTVCKLFDLLRRSVKAQQKPDEQEYFPVYFHPTLLSTLKERMKVDNPSYIKFPANKESFVQVSPTLWSFSRSYTLCVWLKSPAPVAAKKCELFSLSTPIMEITMTLSSNVKQKGSWTTVIDTASKSKGSYEISGNLEMNENEWNLITVKFISNNNNDNGQLSICVNGTVFIENDILFPTSESIVEGHWRFGKDYGGMISSITLYEEELPLPYLQLIYNLGPYISDISKAVVCPKSSAESGHMPLGTLITKEKSFGGKICKIQTIFSVNSTTVEAANACIFPRLGKYYTESSDMVSVPMERDSFIFISLSGQCSLVLNESWIESVMEAGGCILPMHLIWVYSTIKFDGKNESEIAVDDDFVSMRCSVVECLGLLSGLIKCHTDLKEQFIQMHGFHILSYILSNLPPELKKSLIDVKFVDACCSLVDSLGTDSTRGDGICAAMQGLLFDFRIWGCCNIKLLRYYLEKVSNLSLKAGDSLFRCVGVQRILDIFRVHVAKIVDSISPQSSDYQTATDCSDEFLRLLIIIKDSALVGAQKSKGNICIETDALLLSLEESSSNLLIERILRLLGNIRFTSPSSLQQSLTSFRYHDTTTISLWLKKGMSLEVRAHALQNLLWLLSCQCKSVPHHILELRKKIKSSTLPLSSNYNISSRQKLSGETGKLKATLDEYSRQVNKHWRNLNMLNEVIANALQDNVWGNVSPSCLSVQKIAEAHLVGNSNDLANMLSIVMNEKAVDLWWILPFLPILMAHVSAEVGERHIMQINVSFKTDEVQSEMLSCMDDKSWVDILLQIAVIGVFQYSRIRTSVTSDSIQWTSLIEKPLSTYTELAIDALSIVIDYIIKYHIDDISELWDYFQNTLTSIVKSNVSEIRTAAILEERILRRTSLLLLKRIATTADEVWSYNMMTSVESVFVTIQKRNLCDNLSAQSTVREDLLYLDTIDHHNIVDPKIMLEFESNEKFQVLCFVSDIIGAIRKLSRRISFGGIEWILLKRGFLLIVDHLKVLQDTTIIRITQELLHVIKKFSETTGIFSEKKFTKFILATMYKLRDAAVDKSLNLVMRRAFTDMIFNIIKYYSDFRIKFSPNMPFHTEAVVKLLLCTESCHDIDLVFSILDTMKKETASNIISFDDNVEDNGGVIVEPATDRYDNDSTALKKNEDLLLDLGEESARVDIPKPSQIEQVDVFSPIENNSSVNNGYVNFLKIRQGIISERIDSERARLTRNMNAQDISLEAVRKHWRKLRRKIESESFLEAHRCQWKLSVAHEGQFFGRKRVVLRPRFDNLSVSVQQPAAEDEFNLSSNPEADMSSDELNRALAYGYINDVTRDENENILGVSEKEDPNDPKKFQELLENEVVGSIPGSGWGLVDADGSDEGYGVIGVEKLSATGVTGTSDELKQKSIANPDGNSSLLDICQPGDMISDIQYLDELRRSGRVIVETGPSHSGSHRVESSPTKYESRVVMVTASGNCWGQLSLNEDELFFRSTFETEDARKEDNAAINLNKEQRLRRRRWTVDAIKAIYLRRYRMRDSAIEIFFMEGKHRNVFFDFGHKKENAKQRNEFAKLLASIAPSSAFKQVLNMSTFKIVYDHGVQEKWLSGKMSNFDYLMALNTIAGRSFNDLCQYPVMPWILADYSSPSIDLSDPKVFRDLSKPMGALNEDRLKEFLDRFNSFEENVSTGIPAFMYGSHYSTMVGVVLHFLVRLQPFASLHKEMQTGHFDVPDRLFSSIPRSFSHNTTQLSEVKEITPEWFTTPEMFRNINNFYFGRTQDGDLVNDVELPPWAKSPEDFIRINRDALESDYVTEHLHEWIDLIFGYKQRGPEAVDAKNVFYYLTYYGAVDHYRIEDESLRRATELQIAHFGQTPMQLFKVPHPARKVRGPSAVHSLIRPLKNIFKPNMVDQMVTPTCDEESIAINTPCTLLLRKSSSVVVCTSILVDRIICVLDNGVVEILKYSTSDDAKQALQAYQASQKALSKKGTSLSNNSDHSDSFRGIATEDLLFLDSSDPMVSISSVSKSTVTTVDFLSDEVNNQLTEFQYISPAEWLRDGESLIHVEKEISHFDVIPRVPIPKISRSASAFQVKSSTSADALFSTNEILSSESYFEKISKIVVSNRSNKLVFTFGNIDGSINVREIDNKTGFSLAAGEFCAHRKRVISMSVDSNSNDFNIVASIDCTGIILVWTVCHSKYDQSKTAFEIARRPYRQFRVEPSCDGSMHCEVSWHMGIIVVSSGKTISIFSMERNELLRSYQVQFGSSSMESQEKSSIINDLKLFECTCNGSYNSLVDNIKNEFVIDSSPKQLWEDDTSSKYFVRRIAISDYGMIVMHIEGVVFQESLLEFEQEQAQNQHYLYSYSLSGVCTNQKLMPSPITCLLCPEFGEVVISGHRDGTVYFLRCQDLTVLHIWQPHANCVPLVLGVIQAAKTKGIRSDSLGSAETRKSLSLERTLDSSAIISICVGPVRSSPAMICVSTEAGNIYLKAFPDFVKWERNRAPSAFAQLAHVPLQAVKGTLLHAQNWTAETAGIFAQNAKSLADDAMTELKKIKRSSIVKGFSNFFGMTPKPTADEQ